MLDSGNKREIIDQRLIPYSEEQSNMLLSLVTTTRIRDGEKRQEINGDQDTISSCGDAESWLYMTVELTRGNLPWRNFTVRGLNGTR